MDGYIPKMRTPAGIVAEIKAIDPGSEVTEHFIRQLVREKVIPVVWAGQKSLINLDDVLVVLRTGVDRPEREIPVVNGIRRIAL